MYNVLAFNEDTSVTLPVPQKNNETKNYS